MVLFNPGLLRIFLAAVVVFSHVGGPRFGWWAVYVFFMLSGYWVSLMWSKKYDRFQGSYAIFMISRYWRLLPVLLVCNAIAAFVVKFYPAFWRPEIVSDPSVFTWEWWVRSAAVIHSGQHLVLPPVWSLSSEVKYYLLAPLILGSGIFARFFGRRRLIGACLFLLICSVAAGFVGIKAGVYLSCFLLGSLTFDLGWRPSRSMAYASLGTFAVFAAVGLSYPPLAGVLAATAAPDSDLQLLWFSLIGAFLFAPFAMYGVHQKSSPFDRKLGDLAYVVYLFHWIPLEVIMEGFERMIPFPLRLVLFLVAVTVGSSLLYLLVDRPSEGFRHAFLKRWASRPERAVEPA